MFKNVMNLNPNKIYLNMDFNKIKTELKRNKEAYEDFGSIISIYKDDMMITLDNIGKLEIYYNKYDINKFNEQVNEFEDIVKKQISDFRLVV